MSISAIQEFNKRQQQWYASRTGIVVDIQRIGKNTDLIAVKEEPSLQELQPGVWLKKSVIEFPDQNFSNVYDFYWNPKVATVLPEVQSSNKPYTLLETMEHSKEMLAVINGGVFFLTDIADSKPIDLVYNLCIRDRKLFGLPSWDQPIVYVEKKTLCTKEPKAQGMLRIAKRIG